MDQHPPSQGNSTQNPNDIPQNMNRARITEASLRQISESLSRIREVRRSILELSSEMQESQREMDPGHEAITLTSDQDIQAATSMDFESSLEDILSSLTSTQDDRNGTLHSNDDALDSGGAMYNLPAREQLEDPSNNGRQDVQMDTRGREAMDGLEPSPPRFPLAQHLLQRLEQPRSLSEGQSTRNAPGPSQHPVILPPLNTMVGPFASTSEPQVPPSRSSSALSAPSFAPGVARRRTLLDNFLNRTRNTNTNPPLPDDGATSLGRRVAARESGNPSTLLADIENRTATQARRLAELHADFVRFRSQMRNRRSDGASSAAESDASTTTRSTEVQTRSLDSGRSPLSSISRRLRYSRDRDRTSTDTRQSSSNSSQSGRLSLLSNMSIQNLASPVSAASNTRPLLFDEPTSYEDGQGPVITQSEDVPGRSYYITRRLNADGEEYVQNISLSPSEEETLESWLATNRVNPSARTSHPLRRGPRDTLVAPTPEDIPRPRGWVRLDRDGNEISHEEEEELEAQRTEYRLQASQRHSRVTQYPTESMDGTRFMPSTRASIPMEEQHPSVPLVRLVRTTNYPRDYYGSVLDSVLAIGDTRVPYQSHELDQGVIGSKATFEPSILPMPLSEMVPTRLPQPPSARPIFVHGRILAGR